MASELASVVQSAHINHEPSIEHDINPTTAASAKVPAVLSPQQPRSQSRPDNLSDASSQASADDSVESTSTLPSDILRPMPRRPVSKHHLPLPDLRFEQTYLASIKSAESYGAVAYITIRDQVLLPLVQGIGYHMLISGWRYWNRGSKFAGESVGARVRKWWWRVNHWEIPGETRRRGDLVAAAEVKDFYVGQFGSSMGD